MRKTVTTRAHTDEEVRVAVQVLDKKYGYVADPHTAIGYLGLSDASDASGASGALGASSASGASGAVFLATAHPAKFRDVIEPIIGRPVVMPEALAETLLREKRVTRIAPRLAELSKLL
jgi:threonine synthase